MATFLTGLALISCPVEKAEMFERIESLFVNLGITSIESDIEAVCYQGENDADGAFEVIQAVGDLFEGTFYASFAAMGIFLYDEVTLGDKLQLMLDLQKLGNNDNPLPMLAQKDNGDTPEECLAEMLEIVGGWKADKYVSLIARINSSVIPNLINMYPDQDNEPPVPDPGKVLSRERIKAFTREFSGTYVEELIASGMAVGLPVERYVEELNDILPHDSELIHQVIAIVLASNTAQDQLRNRILVEVEGLTDDPNRITEAARAVASEKYKDFL